MGEAKAMRRNNNNNRKNQNPIKFVHSKIIDFVITYLNLKYPNYNCPNIQVEHSVVVCCLFHFSPQENTNTNERRDDLLSISYPCMPDLAMCILRKNVQTIVDEVRSYDQQQYSDQHGH